MGCLPTRRHGLATALLVGALALSGSAEAFHEKGVANCSGCHVAHGGDPAMLAGPSVDGGLLIAESPSDVCLLCHAESLGRVLGTDPLAPPPERGAGNFVFLLEDNINDAPGGASDPILGDASGHNLVAPGHGLSADPRHALSPGGGFPSNRLGCTSCHDPHGNTAFRMLRGVGPVMEGVATFSAPAPAAVGTDIVSRPEADDHHTAYLAGVSSWCANCHGQYHESGSGAAFEHPVDEPLGTAVSQRYNEYLGDANPTGGVLSNAYLAEVPFEDAAAGTASTAGPGPRSRVMCLSCHRAHGSSAPSAGRWDFDVSLLVDDGTESGSHRIPNPYGDAGQGPLCQKCHAGTPDVLAPSSLGGDVPFRDPTAPGW